MASVKVESESKEPDSESVVYKLTKEFSRREKGYKGQIARLQAELGKSGVKTSADGSPGSQTESPQAEKPHLAREHERFCVDCGGENPNFKGSPNVFCGAKGCDGRIPMGHVEPGEVKKLDGGRFEFPNVKACSNCGKDDNAILVA